MLASLVFAFVGASAAHAATFNVTVGANGNLAYDPPFVQAQPGDLINFELWVNYRFFPHYSLINEIAIQKTTPLPSRLLTNRVIHSWMELIQDCECFCPLNMIFCP